MKKPTVQTKKGYKALSLLLAAIMVLTVIPAVSLSAFAETLGSVIVQLSGGSAQRHTVANYQSVYASSTYRYGMANYAVPMDGSNGNPDICVPGLSSADNMVPQGLTYWPAKNWFLISSYEPNDAKPSCVYALSASDGRLVAQFNLQNTSGATVTEHVSGIACSANNLYIADAGSQMAYIPLSSLDVAEGTVKTVRYAGSVNLNLELNNANTSYASFGDGVLWTGNFYISNNSSYNTKANASYGTMMLGYDLSSFTTSAAEWNALVALKGNPSYAIPLDPYGIDRVQCATVKNGFCYVGTSYGRTNDSNVYIFNVDLSAGSGTVTVNGNAKPFIRLKNQRSYPHLPMTEGLMVYDGYLWNIFESAAYLYNGQGDLSKNPTDVLWRFDISTLLGIEREVDDENSVGEAQVKAANVSCGDLTFVVPETIYLYPDALSSAQATSTPFQYYVNNNSDGTVKAGTTAMETTGKIYYSYSGAANATLSYQFYDETLSYQLTGGSANLSSGSITSGGSVNITGGQSPSLAKDTNGFYIQWKLSYTDTTDGKEKAAYAYTYVYKPYTVPVACSTTAGCSDSGWHSKRWAANVTWISGFYDLVQGSQVNKGDWDGNLFYYTKASNFSAFISQNSDGYVGGTRYTGSQAKVTSGFTVSPSSSGGSLGYVVFSGSGASGYEMDTSLSNEDAQYCGQSSSNTYTSPVKNLQAAWYSKTGAEKMSGNLYCDSYGLITIDTSRYSNLNQIPNLGVGMLVYNDRNSSGSSGNWFVKDYTDCSLDGYNTWHSDGSGYYANGNYVIASQGTNYNSSGFDESEGVRYCGAWPRTLLGSTSTQGATKMYMVEGYYANKQDANPQSYSVCKLQATYYNKANLRTAVNNAIKAMAKLGVNDAANGKLTSLYFNTTNDYRWIAFQNAYKKAVIALTKLNSTQNPDALATALNNALANLCTKVTFANSNTGRGTITTVSGKTNPTYVTIGTAHSVSIDPSTYVTATAKTGYSFEGWSTSSTATTGSTGNISVGYNNTLYAIWKPIEYTISYNLNGGTASGNPTSYTIETTPVLLNNPTRTGYTFAGWTGANGTTPQMDVVVPNGVSSGLSQYTTSNPYTANKRDHIFGDVFAVQPGTTYRVYVTAKRTAGNLNMQGGIWYTAQTSGDPWDSYSGTFTYLRDAGNGWGVYYKDVTVPAEKQEGQFYVQLEQNHDGREGNVWLLADCSVTKFTLGNLSYTANWTPHAYTVHFNGNGETGGSTADQSFVYGTAQNLNANGFTRQYTVTYNGNEGTPAVSSNVASYTFAGWQGSKRLISDTAEYSKNNTSGSSYQEVKQWTIAAPFAANEVYVLEFDAKGSGVVTNYFYGANGIYSSSNLNGYWPVGSSVSATGASHVGGGDGDIRHTLTNSYQHFKITWTLASSGNANTNKYVLFRALVGSSVTIKNVVFYKQTGSVDYTNQQSVTNLCSVAGEVYQMRAKWTPKSVTLPTATRTGYTFDGWYDAASGGTKIGNAGASYTPTADITFYAHWTINKYTITFKNGTTTLQSSDWDYGSTPTYSGNTPTKAYDSAKHYTFSGWSPAITTVTGAATYTAQFTGTNHSYTSSVTTPPTCTGAGVTTYTCSCGYSYTDSIPAAIGHIWNYAGAVFNWNGYACPNATVTCTRNSSHTATVTTTVTSSTTNATCTVDGSTVYTATFTVDGTTYTDTKTKTIPALGHDYEWVADGSDSHNAIHRCTRGDFSETVTVTRDDTCILDFGVGSLIPVLNNDVDGAEPDGVTENTSVYNASFSNGEIAFVPQTILSGKITIPYTVTYEGVTCSANVLVIPASNVYLEESYFDFDDENATAKWQTANAEYQQAFDNGDAPGEADSPVNFVPEYNAENSSTYSMGSAKYVTVDKTHTGAKVSFSFTGTGFDLYSVTSGATGVAVVTVTGTKKTTDETTQEETLLVDEHLIVSTYFGYAYGKLYLTTKDGQDVVTLTPTDRPLYYLPAGVTGGYSISGSRRGTDDPNAADKNDNDEPIEAYGWVAGENNVGSLYQVPVISCTDMEYDRYTVVVQPRYAKMYDAAGTNRYDFYVDSVRIYDPIDPDTVEADSEIANAYKAANEYKTEYQELRKILIDANSFRAEQETETVQDSSETPVYGVALLERGGDVTSIEVYEDVGPKNEVYLRNNQAVAFHITTSGSVIPAKLCIGMKLVQGEDEGTVLVNGTPITVDCATELYRDISNCVQWEGTAGAYKTKDPIVIWNTSGEGKIISLTKLKWSYGGTRAAQVVQAPARSLKFSFSRSALDTLALTAQNEGGGTLDASAVTVTWDKDTFELGETATLTITAPATFMRAFVDGEEIAGYTELDNGMRQWTYQVTAEELGLFPADVTLEDANEYRTGALKAPQLTATEPTVELIESAIAWGSDDIMLGEAALLTVTVPAKVVSVTVNGETVTLFDLNEDGSKVFTWTVTPETAGEHVFKVTAAEGHGYASDEILTPALTVNEPAPEEPGNGSQGGSWSLRHLVDAILNFFRKILNMFKIKA